MAVTDNRVIDIVSIDKEGNTVLTISDHLDWSNTHDHLVLLQDKMNGYLAFIESGEIYDSYPSARNRPIRIKVVFQHEPDSEGYGFLSRAKSIVEGAGFVFGFDLLAKSPPLM